MSCNHLCDCLRCGAIVDDLESEVSYLQKQLDQMKVNLINAHKVPCIQCGCIDETLCGRPIEPTLNFIYRFLDNDGLPDTEEIKKWIEEIA